MGRPIIRTERKQRDFDFRAHEQLCLAGQQRARAIVAARIGVVEHPKVVRNRVGRDQLVPASTRRPRPKRSGPEDAGADGVKVERRLAFKVRDELVWPESKNLHWHIARDDVPLDKVAQTPGHVLGSICPRFATTDPRDTEGHVVVAVVEEHTRDARRRVPVKPCKRIEVVGGIVVAVDATQVDVPGATVAGVANRHVWQRREREHLRRRLTQRHPIDHCARKKNAARFFSSSTISRRDWRNMGTIGGASAVHSLIIAYGA